MNQLPPDDQQLLAFLRQHRPTPPQASPDLEEQLMSRIATDRKPLQVRQIWALPSVIAASLLMAWSGYNTLVLAPESANLEAFLENNWNDVVGEQMINLPTSNTSGGDWMSGGNATQTN